MFLKSWEKGLVPKAQIFNEGLGIAAKKTLYVSDGDIMS